MIEIHKIPFQDHQMCKAHGILRGRCPFEYFGSLKAWLVDRDLSSMLLIQPVNATYINAKLVSTTLAPGIGSRVL